MKKFILIILLCPMMLSAQRYIESDTLWTDTTYGVIKRVDTTTNVATVHYFTKENPRLVSVQHIVASGEGQGLQKGKQMYYDEQSRVTSMEVYTLVHDERKGKIRNRIASETYLYPDGKTREEVNISYESVKNYEKKTYVRKCYYPDGKLQYEETMDEKDQKAVYYNEKGKVTKRPKQKFELYLTMPEFPGGEGALFAYLSRTVKYPIIAQENGIQGRVIVRFVVAKDGKIEDVQIARSGGDPSLDKEAMRVIKSMPKWIPGKQRGKPVRVQYHVPVNFRLQ